MSKRSGGYLPKGGQGLSRWQLIQHHGGGEVVAFDYFDNEKEIAVNYLNMPAGADLNALVAEQVMGWYSNGLVWCDKLGSVGYWINDEVRQKGSNFPAFHPSIDIAAAWEVFEFVVNQGFTMSRIHADGKSRWLCDFKDDPLHSIFAYGETVPLAICRAALAAVGADKCRQ